MWEKKKKKMLPTKWWHSGSSLLTRCILFSLKAFLDGFRMGFTVYPSLSHMHEKKNVSEVHCRRESVQSCPSLDTSLPPVPWGAQGQSQEECGTSLGSPPLLSARRFSSLLTSLCNIWSAPQMSPSQKLLKKRIPFLEVLERKRMCLYIDKMGNSEHPRNRVKRVHSLCYLPPSHLCSNTS